MSVYITGDTHGNPIDRFSYGHHPELKSLTKNDIMIQLGDFGVPFSFFASCYDYKKDLYTLRWLNEKPWTTIVVAGNHDDYDYYETLPIVEKYGSQMRQMVMNNEIFNNIYIIIDPCIINIEGKICLCIPGADSHDLYHTPLDPNDPDFKNKNREYIKRRLWFRVKGWSWWPQEKINIDAAQALVNANSDLHYDFIFTHDAPALFFRLNRLEQLYDKSEVNEGQEFFEKLRLEVDFDNWYHGHFHINKRLCAPERKIINGVELNLPGDDRLYCLYTNILKIVDDRGEICSQNVCR